MLCGGTMIPVSGLPSSGPLSGQRVDFRVGRLAVGVHQVQLDLGCGGLAGADEPEVGAGRRALGGHQPAGPGLLDLKPWAMAKAWPGRRHRPGRGWCAAPPGPTRPHTRSCWPAGVEAARRRAGGRAGAVAPLLAPACGAASRRLEERRRNTGETVSTPGVARVRNGALVVVVPAVSREIEALPAADVPGMAAVATLLAVAPDAIPARRRRGWPTTPTPGLVAELDAAPDRGPGW